MQSLGIRVRHKISYGIKKRHKTNLPPLCLLVWNERKRQKALVDRGVCVSLTAGWTQPFLTEELFTPGQLAGLVRFLDPLAPDYVLMGIGQQSPYQETCFLIGYTWPFLAGKVLLPGLLRYAAFIFQFFF